MTEIDVSLRSVHKSYGGVVAVSDLTLNIPRGAFISLLGPSGCGKTTTLRIVAGFARPDRGDVLIRGRRVTEVPPYRRDYGMVFQNFALFPHLSIADNVSFGLRMRRGDRDTIKRQVSEALELVKLTGFDRRFPNELSGGQQQRVALARALVLRPAVLLLDEPLGALDKKLREEMQVEIRDLQRQFAISTLFVTHDQDEAVTMSDSVAVMNHGVIEQQGTPREVFERPRTEFVARFMGAGNILEGRVVAADGDVKTLDLGAGSARVRASDKSVGDRVLVAVRPENVSLARVASDFGVRATVTSVVYHGATTHVHLVAGPADGAVPIVAHLPSRSGGGAEWQRGETVYSQWSEDSTIVLDDHH